MKIYLVLVFTSEYKGANQNAVNQHEAAPLKGIHAPRLPEGIRFLDTSISVPQHIPINLIHPHGSNDKPDKPYGLKTAGTVKEFG